MTQFIFKNDVDQNKIDILLSMIKSWDMEAEVTTIRKSQGKKNSALTLSVGLREGREINDKQLREMAWGTAKRLKK
jgi:hypothetical protein